MLALGNYSLVKWRVHTTLAVAGELPSDMPFHLRGEFVQLIVICDSHGQ